MTPVAIRLWTTALLALATAWACGAPMRVRVGSKNFTEQEILAEIVALLLERVDGVRVERRLGLGGTDICHAAMLTGELDIYVEYTGTALVNVLGREPRGNAAAVQRVVAREYRDRFDLEWLAPIGFNNTYAIAVREKQAEEEGWTSIGDLRASADRLRAGFTSEFVERPDGYPGLRDTYGYAFGSVMDLDPGLMYNAIAAGQVDVICAFGTDGRIEEFGLRTLRDERAFFPPYDAAPVVRAELLSSRPEVRDALAALAGTISDADMRRMNHEVDVLGHEPSDVARRWVVSQVGARADDVATADRTEVARRSTLSLAVARRGEVLTKTREHLVLTFLGTSIAIVIGVPVGILIHRRAGARGPVLAIVEVMQTVPSLAMLAFLFALYGLLGTAPAVTALVLYALLPIVLNTFTGLRSTPPQAIEAANGIGMSSWQRLRIVELPLAAPVIIAGIRAATVLTVGIATLSTYIGAGGLGDFIARGLSRNDTRLTMLGAVPAAIIAVVLSLAIRLAERRLTRA